MVDAGRRRRPRRLDCCDVAGDRGLVARALPRRGPGDGRGRPPTTPSARAGGRLLDGFGRSRTHGWSEPARVGRYGRAAARWARLLAGGRARPGLRVFYGWDLIPAAGEPVAGGTAKLQKLAARWPNTPTDFSLLYLGTTYLPRDLRQLLWVARRRGAKVVVNQDGVAYPGWAGSRTDELNVPLRRALHGADHVLYQSLFSKRSSDAFLGVPDGPWEILPNAVDVDIVHPGAGARGRSCRAARRRPDAGVPSRARARDVPARAGRASRRAAPRQRTARLRPRPDDRPARARRGRGAQGEVRAARGARRLPQGPRPAPHEGQRPMPDRGDRGDGVRRPRRVPGERRHRRARRRRRRRRRAASRRVRAGRATAAGGARRGRLRGARRPRPSSRLRPARARSSASRSPTGSTATPSSSRRSSGRRQRRARPATSPRRRPPSVASWNRARVPSSRTAKATAAMNGRTSSRRIVPAG